MKIAVFGDSYAAEWSQDWAWWKLLESRYGHVTKSFGAAGSSLMYSALMLHEQHMNYDFNIWCVTTTGRISVKRELPNDWWHSGGAMNTQGEINPLGTPDSPIVAACQGYLKYLFDWRQENLAGKAVVNYCMHHLKNVLIIPCFPPPLDAQSNLWEVCVKELQAIFPGQQPHEIYKKYADIRACHLSKTNNSKLAELVVANLEPGILKFSVDDFDYDNIKFNEVLIPLK